MQNIELYIEGQRVDMFKDETVSITDTIQNIKDIGKIFTAFSRTFSLPATKINNKIFKHYYNFDIVGGFDARIKKNSNIELNSLPFKDGKIKLEGVDLKDNKPNTYRITFFGSTVTLKDIIGVDKLSSLSSLTSFNKTYSPDAIRGALQLDPLTNDVIVPLITHTQRLFYDSSTGQTHDDRDTGNLEYLSPPAHRHGVLFSELKYAIRLHKIIEAIEIKYPQIVFSEDFFNITNEPYYNLFLWLHRKKGKVENLNAANSSIIDGFTFGVSDPNTLTQMVSTAALRVSGTPSYYISYSLDLQTSNTESYKVDVFKDGILAYTTGFIFGGVIIDQTDFVLGQGDYTVYVESESDISFSQIQWDIDYKIPQQPVSSIAYSTGIYTYISTFLFDITQQIPEMGILDFLTGVFKFFNLTAYVEKNSTKIVVKTLNDFYSDGGSYDISKYIDVNSSSVNVALPYKEVNFEHEDTKTFLSAIHKQKFNKTWGKSEFTNNGEKLDGSIYSIKTPFSQMKYENLFDINGDVNTNIQVGYYVDDNQESYFGKPLLFYPIKQTNGFNISFLNSETEHVQVINYNIPSNSVSLDPLVSTHNMNFFNEINEYTRANNFPNTLFKVYYSDYITSVFNPRNRITKVSAYLPMKILLNYTLADRFIVGDHQYKINSITTNFKNNKSEIELLNDL